MSSKGTVIVGATVAVITFRIRIHYIGMGGANKESVAKNVIIQFQARGYRHGWHDQE